MPSGHNSFRRIIGISSRTELIIMCLIGMLRSAISSLSFTWDGNIQEIWKLPGPEPSFSVKYNIDYWIKNILSLVVLFRNWTTPLHLVCYIVMLYPVLTGEHHNLMLPWLRLQMIKNIVTDLICTAAGTILCLTCHSCSWLVLEFLVVQVISMMPSVYLWHRLRSYYYDLYYDELDGECLFLPVKEGHGMTLAQRRRATKSLDGTMSIVRSSENRSRINSCLTYDEVFGPTNWGDESDNQNSKSLTTLMTIESEESDDGEQEDSRLDIIDDQNLTPAEKTLKILGLTREEIDATALQLQKKTSTTDLRGSGMTSPLVSSVNEGSKSSIFSETEKNVESRSVGIQVCLANKSKSDASNRFSDLSEQEESHDSKKCECCEKTKCTKEEDTNSDEEEIEMTENMEEVLEKVKSVDCCDQNSKEDENCYKNKETSKEIRDHTNADVRKRYRQTSTDREIVSTESKYHQNDLYPGSYLRAVVERDGIAWDNLKEINFVSVINKALCNEIKPFRLQSESENLVKSITKSYKNLLKSNEEDYEFQSDQNIRGIIPKREDGTKFVCRHQEFSNVESTEFFGPTSASFGVESDILAINSSSVFEKMPISNTQSLGSTDLAFSHSIRPGHDTDVDFYFKSSFQRHSKMFDDTTAQFEPLKCRERSSYRGLYGVNADSRLYQTNRYCPVEKTYGCSYNSDLYLSRNTTSQYKRDNYHGLEYSQGNFSGNNTDSSLRDILRRSNSGESENEQVAFTNPTSSIKENDKLNRASQTSSTMLESVIEKKMLSKYTNAGDELKSNSEAITQTEELGNSKTTSIVMDESVTQKKSSASKSSGEKSLKDKRSLISSSRSSKIRETHEERKAKEIQALRYYNEKTLSKYKKEMDARNEEKRVENKLRNHFGIYGNKLNQTLYVPPVPELDKPEKDLISNIENAYAKFTRSKPVDPVNSEALQHRNFMTKELFDIYNVYGKMKKDLCEMKIRDTAGMRKQHSKYSKFFNGVTNEFDVTSKSCKKIEGSQKGRDLDRTLARENIRAQEMEVNFLGRQTNDKPSTSKNVTITTIKSFLPKICPDSLSAVSSEIIESETTGSPMIEILNSPEEISCRIEDSEYYRWLRKTNVLENVREAVKNIDWSFKQPTLIEIGNRRKRKEANNTCSEIARIVISSEGQNIVHKTTENILQSIFSHSDDSERGFRLGESANGFYPIFNTEVIAMEEIIRAAALRGSTNEFISQPAIEIEIPEIVDGNLYSLTNSPSESSLRSTSGLFKCCISSEDKRVVKNRSENDASFSITTFTAPDIQQKKPEAVKRERDSMDRNETTSVADEKASSLLNKLISSTFLNAAEINLPVVGEDLPGEPKNIRGEPWSLGLKDLEDQVSFIIKVLSAAKKSRLLSKSQNCENSFEIRRRTKRISSEEVRLALQNITCQSPKEEVLELNETQINPDVASYRGILNHFNAGGKELRSVVFQFFDQFPYCEGLPTSVRGSELITGLHMRSNLYAIENKLGEIMITKSGNFGNLPILRNYESEGVTTQIEISQGTKFGNMITNTSTRCWNNLPQKKDLDKNKNNIVLLANSEMPETMNFKREMITSAYVQATNQGRRVENEFSTPNNEELIKLDSSDLTKLKSDVEFTESWIKDGNKKMGSRSSLVFQQPFAFEKRSEVSSLMNFRFPVNGELQKLQNLVQTVANCMTITSCSSTQSNESFKEVVESDLESKDLNAGCGNESLNNFEHLQTNVERWDSQDPEVSVPKPMSSLKNAKVPVNSKNSIDRYSSWDKVISLSTKRQIAMGKRKDRSKKVVNTREPLRRVVKVIKLMEEKDVDFSSARPVPQRGRGLSSGYLMDSDSDGNFTVSRPSSHDSSESEISQNSQFDSKEPEVFSNPLEALKFFPASTTLHSRTTDHPIETCWSSSSANTINKKFISVENTNATNNLDKKINDDFQLLQTRESLEISAVSLRNEGQSSRGKYALPEIIRADENALNTSYDGESVSAESDVELMNSVDAAGIENKLKDVLEQILNHRYRGVNDRMTESAEDSQSNKYEPKNNTEEQEEMKSESVKKIQKLLPRDNNERFNVHYKGLESTSRNFNAVSFEISPRNSKTIVEDAATGTDYNIEVLKDLLNTFEKFHSINIEKLSEQISHSSETENVENRNDFYIDNQDDKLILRMQSNVTNNLKSVGSELTTNSYDSYSSQYYQNTNIVFNPSSREMSMSGHTFFEEFPEQIGSSYHQFSSKFCELSEDDAREKYSKKETNTTNFNKSINHASLTSLNSSESCGKLKKDSTPKKTGIPRPMKDRKDGKKK